jgi:hypothetical protein
MLRVTIDVALFVENGSRFPKGSVDEAWLKLHDTAAKQTPVSIMMMIKIQNPTNDAFRINLHGFIRHLLEKKMSMQMVL